MKKTNTILGNMSGQHHKMIVPTLFISAVIIAVIFLIGIVFAGGAIIKDDSLTKLPSATTELLKKANIDSYELSDINCGEKKCSSILSIDGKELQINVSRFRGEIDRNDSEIKGETNAKAKKLVAQIALQKTTITKERVEPRIISFAYIWNAIKEMLT